MLTDESLSVAWAVVEGEPRRSPEWPSNECEPGSSGARMRSRCKVYVWHLDAELL